MHHQATRTVTSSQEAIARSRALIRQSDTLIQQLGLTGKPEPQEHAAAPAVAQRSDLLELVEDRTLQRERVPMDGKHFRNCRMVGCALLYNGQPVVVESSNFEDCRFEFGAEAALTLQYLECFGLIGSDQRAALSLLSSPPMREQAVN